MKNQDSDLSQSNLDIRQQSEDDINIDENVKFYVNVERNIEKSTNGCYLNIESSEKILLKGVLIYSDECLDQDSIYM